MRGPEGFLIPVWERRVERAGGGPFCEAVPEGEFFLGDPLR